MNMLDPLPMGVQIDNGVSEDGQRVLALETGNLWMATSHIPLFCMYGNASNGMMGSMHLVIKTRRTHRRPQNS